MMRKSAETAADMLVKRISELAPTAKPDEVKTLADSWSAIVHGPQGGRSESQTDYTSHNRNEGQTDYHYTTHGDGEDRRPIGFRGD